MPATQQRRAGLDDILVCMVWRSGLLYRYAWTLGHAVQRSWQKYAMLQNDRATPWRGDGAKIIPCVEQPPVCRKRGSFCRRTMVQEFNAGPRLCHMRRASIKATWGFPASPLDGPTV